MAKKKETMREAFERQTKIYRSGDPLEVADVISKEGSNFYRPAAVSHPELEKQCLEDALTTYAKLTGRYKQLKENTTRLKPGELDEKTAPHSSFVNYDHSLEKNRWKGNSRSSSTGEDGIEMGDLTSEDVL